MINNYKELIVNFKKLELGPKLIIISSIVAFISLFLPWNHKIFKDMNAIPEGEFVLFLPYIYPFIMVLKDKQVKFIKGFIACVLPLIFTSSLLGIYSVDINSEPLYGMYLFFISSVSLLVGYIKTIQINPSE